MSKNEELFPFSKVIEEVEEEIRPHYLGGAIQWTDDNFDGAWSKLLDQFDKVLLTRDISKINVFTKMYKTQVLGYIQAYKAAKAKEKAAGFIAGLKAKKNP